MKTLSESAYNIAQKRYFFNEDEGWDNLSIRCGDEVSQIETQRDHFKEKFIEMIYNMEFIPAGRILRNLRRIRGSLFNCYVLPCQDSIEEIGQFIKDCLIVWSEGGGIGVNASFLRPEGAIIKGKGGTSSGPISFLNAANAAARCIESGGQRRAAALALMTVNHPDIIKFIDAKNVDKILDSFNISVGVTEKFLEAVEKNDKWDLTFNHQKYATHDARFIWEKIMNNMVSYAEPGLLNWDNLRSNNSYYFDPITSTNPCIVGDTLLAVADGRNAVPIKQLAKEGKDVPVYCLNNKTNKLEIKMGRRPRKTGSKVEVWKLILDDGSEIKTTPNHKFILNNGKIVELKDLAVGESLRIITKIRNPKDKFDSYWHFKDGFSKQYEHRLIYNFNNPKDKYTFGNGDVIHHIDFNKLNNNPDNLFKMTKEDHDILHGEHIKGENNPWYKMSDESKFKFASKPGLKNPNSKGYNPEEYVNLIKKYTIKYNRTLSNKEWEKICKENNYPISSFVLDGYSMKELLEKISKEINVYWSASDIFHFNRYLQIKDNTDLNIFFDEKIKKIFVIKNCEYCGNEFIRNWDSREVCFCSLRCSSFGGYTKEVAQKMKQNQIKRNKNKINVLCEIFNDLKFKLKRTPMKKEFILYCKTIGQNYRFYLDNECTKDNRKISWNILKKTALDFNHRVISIEFYGYEDVYNITVDDNHNFAITIKTEDENKYYQIFTPQCGEAPLNNYGICNLGSLVLTKFVSGSRTNWKRMEEIIRLAVRFLDNIIDINKYILHEFDLNAHNGRRIGIGVMGLAEYFFAKKIRYGSKKSISETEKVLKFIRDISYDESIKLSSEKGAFNKFDPVQYGKAHFIRTLPAALRMRIKKYGIRNVTLMAMAPTGTISLLPEVTSGIEPLFSKAYIRSDKISERYYIHPIYKECLRNDIELPEWFVDTNQLSPSDHLDIQAIVQKYTDGAVSKTINMPKGTTTSELSELLLEYIHDLKGCTVYVDGSREGQILNKVNESELKEYITKYGEINNSADEQSVKCASGVCEI